MRVFLAVLILLTLAPIVRAGEIYDEAPIRYSQTTPQDRVQSLIQRLAQGKVHIDTSSELERLQSLLRALEVPVSSQVLVFSKTSFQHELISPDRPRAIYFNDDTYVGYVPTGDVIEIAATDPRLGSTFYTVPAHGKNVTPVRQTESCLQCHTGSSTHDLPGLLMRSLYCEPDGRPIFPAGTFVTTQNSPLSERWGGWYVTAGKGPAGMGNRVFDDAASRHNPSPLPLLSPVRQIDLSEYPVATSDPAALVVLAHQVEAHNRFTRASYESQIALRDEEAINRSMGVTPKPGEHSDSTRSRVASACEPLVEYLLFRDEAPPGLPPEAAQSVFATGFSQAGGLRELDLVTRTFRRPLSYLIGTEAFQGLPPIARDYVDRRLWEVLTGRDQRGSFAKLTLEQRREMLAGLRAARTDLPAYYQDAAGS